MALRTDLPGGGKVDIQAPHFGSTTRADLFAKMLAVQKFLKARSFAVLKVDGIGSAKKRRLVCEMENSDRINGSDGQAIIDAYGPILLDHLESSVLPVVWNSEDGLNVTEITDLGSFVIQLKANGLPSAGIGFPMHLGALGNGCILFSNNGDLDIQGSAVLDAHGRCSRLMTQILSLDEARIAMAGSLSDREIACLQLAGDGRISEEIAGKLGLSVHTVNAYLGSATIKLDSVNRIQAIAKAIRLGYIN